jgi:hypothetical protein
MIVPCPSMFPKSTSMVARWSFWREIPSEVVRKSTQCYIREVFLLNTMRGARLVDKDVEVQPCRSSDGSKAGGGGLRWPSLAVVGLWTCVGCRGPVLAFISCRGPVAGVCWPSLAFWVWSGSGRVWWWQNVISVTEKKEDIPGLNTRHVWTPPLFTVLRCCCLR